MKFNSFEELSGLFDKVGNNKESENLKIAINACPVSAIKLSENEACNCGDTCTCGDECSCGDECPCHKQN